jgi:LmbE family N-acetylglucosaminyl deacetylase
METRFDNNRLSIAVVVAHPDDETLWAGGTILQMTGWRWFVGALCRKSDPDRAPRFHRALEALGVSGALQDLDDGPEQVPLDPREVEDAVLSLLPAPGFDIILTHSPFGEYTRHRRHEETSRAVLDLWRSGRLPAFEVWMFAYEDGGGKYLPRASRKADCVRTLPQDIWERKISIIADVYGFGPDSFEYRTTPRKEAFRFLSSPADVRRWSQEGGGRER